MSKKSFYRSLDHPDQPITGEDTRQLMALMDEVAQLDSPEPGPTYWNHFNSRLQQRMAKNANKKRRFLFWPALSAVAAAVLIWLYVPRAEPKLEDLSKEQLGVLSQAFDPYEQTDSDAGSFELQDEPYDLLLQALSDEAQPEDLLLDDLGAEELELLRSGWDLEG